MIRQRPTFKKPQSQIKPKTHVNKQDIQNTKPISFNTKGYFSPDQPFNQEYLKVKQQVFKKYRDQDQQLVVLDPKQIRPSLFIQKGLLKPSNQNVLNEPNGQRVFNTFLKNYMNRKQKKQKTDQAKYFSNGTGLKGAQVRRLQPSVRQSCKTSRCGKTSSRQSTTRSISSTQQLW